MGNSMALSRLVLCALMLSAVLASVGQQNPPEFDFRKLSSWPGYARGSGRDIQVAAGKAYLAMGDGGLCIVNVQDPNSPSVLGRVDVPGIADEVDVLNNLAFLACGTGGVHVINVANPAAPVRVTTIQVAAKVTGISTMDPHYVFIAEGAEGIKAYDVSNPAAPASVGSFKRGGEFDAAVDVQSIKVGFSVNDVDYIRSLLFVAYGPAGGYVFDVADPANPVQLTALTGNMTAVSRDPETAYFVDETRDEIRYLDLHSVSSPTFPVFGRGKLPADMRIPFLPRFNLFRGSGFITSKGTSTALDGNYIMGANSDFPFSARLSNVAIRAAAPTRNFDYVFELVRGFQIYSAASPTFTPMTTLTIGGRAMDIRTSGDKVFVSDADAGIQAFVFDTDKTLKHVATYDLGYTLNFDVSGNYLYRVGYIGDFNAQVLDISNPAQPRLVVNLVDLLPPAPGRHLARNITVRDGRAFLSAGSLDFYPSKIHTFDVSNPEAPIFLASTTAGVEDMQVVGQTLFAVGGGLGSYSINADGTLKLSHSVDFSSSPSNLKVIGNTAYVCAESEGLKIFDVSDPSNMQLRGTYDTAGNVLGVDVVGTNAFVADARGGFLVLDVSDPTNPKLVARQPTDKPMNDVKVTDGFIFAANDAEGVTCWKYGPGAAQTIDFPPIPDATTRTEPFMLTTPIASSGLPVQLSISSGPATLVNGTVTITGPGVVTVRAFQSGNAVFSSATVERSFNVVEIPRAAQTIIFPPIADASIEDDPFDISVSASSGLPIEAAISGPATLEGPTVTITGEGEVTITVTQAGDRDFAPATLQRKFTVRDLASAVAALVRAGNPAIADADSLLNADADRDGLPNVVEFLLRTNPTSGTSMEGHTTGAIVDTGGARYLKASYLKPRISRYATGIQIADFADYPSLTWISIPAGFNSDGTGSFLLPVANYRFPLIRFVIQYP
jgi:hypothetical protein